MTQCITSSHSLSAAILLKKDNQTVSEKTLNKMAEKLIAINQRCINKPIDYIQCMREVSHSLDTVKNDMVYNQLKTVIKQHAADYIRSYNAQLSVKAKRKQKINLNEVQHMELIRQLLLKSRPAQSKFIKNVCNVSSKAAKMGVKRTIAVSEQIRKQRLNTKMHRIKSEARYQIQLAKVDRHSMNAMLRSSFR